MRYNNLIASLTIALVALASLGAMIWQVVQGHDTDAQLAGILGLSLGAFLRMPGQTDAVQIKQPAGQPVPVNDVNDVNDAGVTVIELCYVVITAAVVALALVALFGRP